MNGEGTVVPRLNVKLDLRVIAMLVFFSLGDETARAAMSDRLEHDFNGGNTLEPEGGFEGLKRDVAACRAEIVPRFEDVPLNQDEVDTALLALEAEIHSLIDVAKAGITAAFTTIERRAGGAIKEFDATIYELQHTYDVSDTQPLEHVRDKLQAWLDELDRQHVPHPSYPEGPV